MGHKWKSKCRFAILSYYFVDIAFFLDLTTPPPHQPTSATRHTHTLTLPNSQVNKDSTTVKIIIAMAAPVVVTAVVILTLVIWSCKQSSVPPMPSSPYWLTQK